jgi:50S ribosomal subunit-associated GTPase HflX
MVPQWNEMVKLEITKLHFVVFVLPLDRLSKSLLQEIGMMMNYLVEWGMRSENVIVVLNKCDFYIEQLLNNYESSLQTLVELFNNNSWV